MPDFVQLAFVSLVTPGHQPDTPEAPPPRATPGVDSSIAPAAAARGASPETAAAPAPSDERTAGPAPPPTRRRDFDPGDMALRGRIGAYRLHATHDPRETTRKARETFLARFEREVDPDGTLPEEVRQRRAEYARRAYFARLARSRQPGHRHHRGTRGASRRGA